MKMFGEHGNRPLWREEFPIEKADEGYITRRQFTKFLVLTSAGMFVGTVWIALRSLFRKKPVYPEMDVLRMGAIPVGGVHLFPYPGPNDACIMVRAGENDYVAYSQKCTHLSCAVYYSPQFGRLECPCHEGYFSLKTGQVLQGPPPRPLPRIVLEQRGETLVAVGVDFGEQG